MSNDEDLYMYMQLQGGKFHRVNLSKLLCEADRDRKLRWEETTFNNSVTDTVPLFDFPDYFKPRHTNISWDVVAIIDSKLYVMVGLGAYTSDGTLIRDIVFKVYDPFQGLWKILPRPPVPIFNDRRDSIYLDGHYEWGHNLVVVFMAKSRTPYAFDTIEEKWTTTEDLPHLVTAVEFSGFLIGVEQGSKPQRIVAFKLDEENGLPDSNSKHTLDELWEIFFPDLLIHKTFLIRSGDDRVIFLAITDRNSPVLLVAVFRVLISTVGSISVVGAVFEHKQIYKVEAPYAYSYKYRPTLVMQNAPSFFGSLLDGHLFLMDAHLHDEDDDTPSIYTREEQTVENKLKESVEWDDGLKEKSLYLCIVENRTDYSVSYIIKATKFIDLISAPSINLRQVASTSGYHLPCLPRCGVFGSQILFAGSGEQDDLRTLQPVQEFCMSPDSTPECDRIEPVDEILCSKDIYYYDVTSSHSNIKRFSKDFKGMKPELVFFEVEGKLYALAGSPKPKYLNPGPFFEVFNPIEKNWSPLPDPPPYTKFKSLRNSESDWSGNSHVIAGTNILVWGDESPRVFCFDMSADSMDKDWRLVLDSRQLLGGVKNGYDGQIRSTIAVDIHDSGGGDFILFTYRRNYWSPTLQAHIISREFESVVCSPPLELPESVSSFFKAEDYWRDGDSCFVYLGGSRVCLVLSFPFKGPYCRSFYKQGEIDKMSIIILVFEFEVTENREAVAVEFVLHRVLEYDTSSCNMTNSRTTDAHMMGAFLL